MINTLHRAIFHGRGCHGEQTLQNPPIRQRHAIHGRLRGLPDPEDEPESGHAEWMPSPPVRAAPSKSASSC